MPTGTPDPGTALPQGGSNFRIDFIDPLFAVAIHIGFVEGLLPENWLQSRGYPSHLSEFANLFLFIAGFWTIVASWVGYHISIQSKPIIRGERFVLDILLLTLYILLLLYFKSPTALAALMISIYILYVAWDFYKTKEYPDRYYDSGSPSGLTYLAFCFAEWFQPGRHERLRNEAVTFGWMIFLLILFPFTLFSVTETNWGKISYALVLIVANSIYRYDKRSGGTWICSTPFKLFMASLIAYLILYQTKVRCFSS